MNDPEDLALADVDTLMDWIAGECYQVPVQSPPYFWSHTDFDASAHTTPMLVAIAFTRGQRKDVSAAALRELQDRYLTAHTKYVHRLASQMEAA